MPLSKCIEVEVRPWFDKVNNIDRMAFRFTYEEIVANAKLAFMMRFEGKLKPRYLTLFADRSLPLEQQLEHERMCKEFTDAGPDSFPNRVMMTYDQEVLPFCRIYTSNTKNHAIGELIKDPSGKPRLYNTIAIHCEAKLKNGEEVPVNPAQVRAQAEQQRDYFINNDDKSGFRRFFELSTVMNYEVTEDPIDDNNDLPVDAIVPAPAKKFDPNTGQPIA